MSSEKKKTGKSLSAEERASEVAAQIVFEDIYENEKIIKATAQILADSIRFAHKLGDQCWSLTLYPAGVRLNVGPVEVLVLGFDEALFILNGTYSDEMFSGEIAQYISASEIFYPSVPGEQRICYLPADKVEDLYPAISEAHQSFIEMAAKSRRKSSWRSSFSPGVILYLNRVLRISLPVPSYFSGRLEKETLFPDEVTTTGNFQEGMVSKALVNKYERDPKARKTCIEYYGPNCQVCDFNFEAVYGVRGKGFIHVHHLRPVSHGEYEVDPIADLRPVCPNCHAMIHRYGLLSIEEMKSLVNNNRLNL